MVKRGDLLKVFFIYLCLCHVVPGHPCGHNPLARFRPLARVLGTDVNYLLGLLYQVNRTLYDEVRDEWRLYADCVGLVDTGYFKRSGQNSPPSVQEHGASRHERAGPEEEVTSRAERLMTLMKRVSDAVGDYASLRSSSASSSSQALSGGEQEEFFMVEK